MDMQLDELEFSTIKEHRGWYFVEYYPPRGADWLASLSLVVLGEETRERVAGAMEAEARRWFEHYPCPLIVFAFDDSGSAIDLEDVRACSSLMAYEGVVAGESRL